MAMNGTTTRRPPKSFSPPKSVLFVGPYCIAKQIGEGAFSSVFLASHVVNGEQVAIKVLHKPTLMKSETAFRFATREYSVLERVRGHPHVINLIKRYDTDEYTCLVMEYLRGGDLIHVMTGGPLVLKRTFNWFYQMVGALEFCHRNGICHRDIKLENILLDENDQVRLCDFGMANFKSSNAMQFATYCGSPHYISPEIARGEKYDAVKCDVWSLGVVLYALNCRKLPFNDVDTTQVITKVLQGKFVMPPTLGESLSSLIQQMLTTDPAKRITLAGVKKTKFWRDGCMAFGLNVEGVSNIVSQPTASPLLAGPSSGKIVVSSPRPGSPRLAIPATPSGQVISASNESAMSPLSPKSTNWGGFDALSAVCSSIEEHTLLRVDPRQVQDVEALQELVAGLQQLCRALAGQGKSGAPSGTARTTHGGGGGGGSGGDQKVAVPSNAAQTPKSNQKESVTVPSSPRTGPASGAFLTPDSKLKLKVKSSEKIDKVEDKPPAKDFLTNFITPRRAAPAAHPHPTPLLTALEGQKSPKELHNAANCENGTTVTLTQSKDNHKTHPTNQSIGATNNTNNVLIDGTNGVVNINGVKAVMVPVPVPVPVGIPISMPLTNASGAKGSQVPLADALQCKGAFTPVNVADTKTPTSPCTSPSPLASPRTENDKPTKNHKAAPKWMSAVMEKLKKSEKRSNVQNDVK